MKIILGINVVIMIDVVMIIEIGEIIGIVIKKIKIMLDNGIIKKMKMKMKMKNLMEVIYFIEINNKSIKTNTIFYI